MRPKRLKVPRASIGVTIADDSEYIALMQTPSGREAFALFTALIVQAKVQRNGGRFEEPEAVVSFMVRWPLDAFKSALQALVDAPGRWVLREGQAIIIRSFVKWNDTRGGQRPGAGRKPAAESKLNQSEIKRDSNGVIPVSVSVSGSPVGDPSAGEAPACAPSRAARPARSKPADLIRWSVEHGWQGITDADREAWRSAYPAVRDLDAQLARIAEWLKSNPSRAKKTRWRKFLTDWLAREQDRGGDLRISPRATRALGSGDNGRADSWDHLAPGVRS